MVPHVLDVEHRVEELHPRPDVELHPVDVGDLDDPKLEADPSNDLSLPVAGQTIEDCLHWAEPDGSGK